MPCGVTMISLLENNKNNPIVFHIIGMDLKKESKEKLLSISLGYKDVSVLFYEIKKELLESHKFSLFDSKHLSLATYSRLFLEEILPQNIDKILYLDCDMIIAKDLSDLWNTDIGNYSVAGVPDLYVLSSRIDVFEHLGYDIIFQYVNAGMLLINLRYWRERNLIKRFLNFYEEKHNKLTFHDQDIINGTLYDTKLLLPMKFNVLDYYYSSRKKNFVQYEDEVCEAIKEPVIIHYTSSDKPWYKSCLHPLKDEFFKYKNISPWKNDPLAWPNISLSKKIQYYKRVMLYALKLKEPKYINIKKDTKTGQYIF